MARQLARLLHRSSRQMPPNICLKNSESKIAQSDVAFGTYYAKNTYMTSFQEGCKISSSAQITTNRQAASRNTRYTGTWNFKKSVRQCQDLFAINDISTWGCTFFARRVVSRIRERNPLQFSRHASTRSLIVPCSNLPTFSARRAHTKAQLPSRVQLN